MNCCDYAKDVGQDKPKKEPVQSYDAEHGTYKTDDSVHNLSPGPKKLPLEPTPFKIGGK